MFFPIKRPNYYCPHLSFFWPSSVTSLFFYLFSLAIVSIDLTFAYRWLALILWFSGLAFLPITLAIKKLIFWGKSKKVFLWRKGGWLLFVFVVLLAFIFSFSFLVKYPFVAIYDQIRDGGLNVYQIANGSIKNIFGYGRYASHGLIIPVINLFFYKIFNHSVLTFRFPGAIISIVNVILLYFVARKSIKKEAAPWAALILLTLPLHLYYARTEIVVIYSSFFTSLFLLLVSFFMKKNDFPIYAVLGLTLGFSAGFHASIRTVCLLTIIIISVISFFKIHEQGIKKIISGLILMGIFFMIGFGPRVLFSPPEVFFQTKSLAVENIGPNVIDKVSNIAQNYEKSLLVYIKEPAMSTHYPNYQPILDPILAVFFIIGFLTALFWSKNNFLKIICVYALLIPFTNSAITEAVNSDHRLLPTLPIVSLLTAYGFFFLLSNFPLPKIFGKFKVFFFPFLLTVYLLIKGINFFSSEAANKNYRLRDYLSMQTIYFLTESRKYQPLEEFCLHVSPNNFAYFNLMHVQEQYQYFIPEKTIAVIKEESLSDNQMFISTSCILNLGNNSLTRNYYCSKPEKFVCPKSGEFIIISEKNPLPQKIPNLKKKFIKINSEKSLAP